MKNASKISFSLFWNDVAKRHCSCRKTNGNTIELAGKCEGKWENVLLLLLNPDQAPASREEERGPNRIYLVTIWNSKESFVCTLSHPGKKTMRKNYQGCSHWFYSTCYFSLTCIIVYLRKEKIQHIFYI
jgi:hypothetical protein